MRERSGRLILIYVVGVCVREEGEGGEGGEEGEEGLLCPKG